MRISDWSSDVCSSDLNLRSKIALLMRLGPLPAKTSTAAPANSELGSIATNRNRDPIRMPRRRRRQPRANGRSEEHTSALQSLMRHQYAVFCLTKKRITTRWMFDHILTTDQY